MKIQKSGKTVTIARDELEALVNHIGEFERIVKALERQEAAGKLTPELTRPWAGLKKFLDAEEAKTSIAPRSATTRRVRCCILNNEPLTNIVDCRETNTRYVFALAACVAAALLGGFDATLVAGSCAQVGGCPQAG